MVTDTVQENNSVIIAGRIVEECQFSHEVYGEGFYIFKVADVYKRQVLFFSL